MQVLEARAKGSNCCCVLTSAAVAGAGGATKREELLLSLSHQPMPPLQVLEARAKGRTAARPAAGLDPALAVARGGLEERHNAAVISWAEAAEELARVEAHFDSQTLTLQVGSLGCLLWWA